MLFDVFAATSRKLLQSGLRPTLRSGYLLTHVDGSMSVHSKCMDGPMLVLSHLAAAAYAQSSELAAPPSITWSETTLLLGSEQTILVDVRSAGEFHAHHVPGSIHIPLDQLPNRHSELPKETKIVVVCQGGDRSEAGRDFLQYAGFPDAVNVSGGMEGWPEHGVSATVQTK